MKVPPRRGWRERIEAGLYRAHRVSCPSTRDRRPGRRCKCPFEIKAPGRVPGTTRNVTVLGGVTDARAERRRLMAVGRPESNASEGAGTLHTFAAEWFTAGEPLWTPGTLSVRDHAYRTRIEPAFGDRRLTTLRRPEVEAWAADLIERGHGRRAVEIAVQTLRAMLSVALDADLIETNPAARVRLPPPPPRERSASDRVIDQSGRDRLIAAAHDVRQETIIRAAVEAGLRRGEIAGLTWPDVLLDQRRLVVRQAVWQSKKTGKVVQSPKAGKMGRVAISQAFAARLADWHSESVLEGGADPLGYVWPGRAGGPMSPSSITHLVAKVGKRAGLVDARGRHIASAHGLRHSAGSIALSEGVPLTVVSAQLRHSRPAFTAARYSHLLSDAELDRFAAAHNAEAVEDAVGKASDTPHKQIAKPKPAR